MFRKGKGELKATEQWLDKAAPPTHCWEKGTDDVGQNKDNQLESDSSGKGNNLEEKDREEIA